MFKFKKFLKGLFSTFVAGIASFGSFFLLLCIGILFGLAFHHETIFFVLSQIISIPIFFVVMYAVIKFMDEYGWW